MHDRSGALPPALPDYGSVCQQGIIDPCWPLETPEGVTDAEYEPYRGRVDPQRHMLLLRADVRARDGEELRRVLRSLTAYARRNESYKVSHAHLRPLEHLPSTWRVTITIGFGATLFEDAHGHDRFGISPLRPRQLKVMPRFPGDSSALHPRDVVSDLVVLIQSDSHYVNVALARYLVESFSADFAAASPGATEHVLVVRGIETGFGRPDKREFLRFDDGIDNLRPGEGEEMDRLVFVGDDAQEPAWCRRGSYMVYRKIREHLPRWERGLADAHPGVDLAVVQARMIGREKASGCPMSRATAGPEGLTPVYPDPRDPADGPLDAHVRKVQPRRPTVDLFGVNDLNRRFLRRPYPWFDGLSPAGEALTGLHFIAFMRSIQEQFEHVTNMWQLNPDFPVPGTGVDALYANGILETVDGGYFFCPREPVGVDDFFGSALFAVGEG